MDFLIISTLNGVSYGLLLFMLSAGLTLIFSMMGVLNFAHASFYMLGAYFAYTLNHITGFWVALVLAVLLVAACGAIFERTVLRSVHSQGHVAELLVTFGLAYVVLEVVQLTWGRSAVDFRPPQALKTAAFTLVSHAGRGLNMVWGTAPDAMCQSVDVTVRVVCSPFPATRAMMALVAFLMLVSIWLLLTRTRVGLIIQAALTHPSMVGALGHNVPLIFMLVFGFGAGLAGLAGVIGGSTFITEPSMATAVGSIIFVVVVVGGMGSLGGAFLASLVIGVVQTFAVALDYSIFDLAHAVGLSVTQSGAPGALSSVTVSQLAPMLPYFLLVLMLVFRPKGLLGASEG